MQLSLQPNRRTLLLLGGAVTLALAISCAKFEANNPLDPLVSGSSLGDGSSGVNTSSGMVASSSGVVSGSSRVVSSSSRALSSSALPLSSEGPLDFNDCVTAGFCDTDEIGGKTYQWTQIDTLLWMRNNLDTGTFVGAAEATPQANDALAEKYCFNDSEPLCDQTALGSGYGGLYQWAEAMNLPASDNTNLATASNSTGLCPTGWRIPTVFDWLKLGIYIDQHNQGGSDNPGFSLKTVDFWVGGAGGGTDHFGFQATPGGWLETTWGSAGIGWWASSETNFSQAQVAKLSITDHTLTVAPASKTNAYYVRCVRRAP